MEWVTIDGMNKSTNHLFCPLVKRIIKDNTVSAGVYPIFIAMQERTKLNMQLPVWEVPLMDDNRKLGQRLDIHAAQNSSLVKIQSLAINQALFWENLVLESERMAASDNQDIVWIWKSNDELLELIFGQTFFTNLQKPINIEMLCSIPLFWLVALFDCCWQ